MLFQLFQFFIQIQLFRVSFLSRIFHTALTFVKKKKKKKKRCTYQNMKNILAVAYIKKNSSDKNFQRIYHYTNLRNIWH